MPLVIDRWHAGMVCFPYGNRAKADVLAISPLEPLALVRFREHAIALLGKKQIIIFRKGERISVPIEHLQIAPRVGQSPVERVNSRLRIDLSRRRREE